MRYATFTTPVVTVTTGATRTIASLTLQKGLMLLEASVSFDGDDSTEDKVRAILARATGTASGGTAITGVPLDDGVDVDGPAAQSGPITGLSLVSNSTYFSDFVHPQSSIRYGPNIRCNTDNTIYVWQVVPGAETHGAVARFTVGY